MEIFVPRRIFLDTNVVNLILDNGAAIHENCEITATLTPRVSNDVEALRLLFWAGRRAAWELAISPLTYKEVTATSDPFRRKELETWFFELWAYWSEILESDNDEAGAIASPRTLAILPDANDRQLIQDALTYRCDTFCTRDWSTILRHRTALTSAGIRIITPSEWWELVRPWAALWI